MSLSLRKTFAIILSFTLLLVSVHMHPVSAATDTTLVPDGEYSVPFRYLKDGSSETSVANDFVVAGSGTLIVEDGVAVFEHLVTAENYSTFAYFGTRNPGADKAVIINDGEEVTIDGIEGYTSAEVVESDDEMVKIRLEIEDVWSKQDILMHIYDEENIYHLPIPYNNWYHAQLELQLETIDFSDDDGDGEDGSNDDIDIEITLELFQEKVTVAYDVYHSTSEGTGDGFYPIGSKTELYNKIQQAEKLVEDNSGDQIILEAAYKIVDGALREYESLQIIVDKSMLELWVQVASDWLETAKDAGVTESGSPNGDVAVSEGEYPVQFKGTFDPGPPPTFISYYEGPATLVSKSILQVQEVIDDPHASQEEVDEMYNEVYYAYEWDDIANQQFKASEVEILVLDSHEEDAQISEYADEIKSTAVILQQTPPHYEAYANITFIDHPDDDIEFHAYTVKQVTANADTGSYGNWTSSPARIVSNSTTDTEKVYQTKIRFDNPLYENNWSGLWKLRYPDDTGLEEEDQRVIYISFNKEQLDALNTLIAQAQTLYDQAEVGTKDGQYSEASKAELQAAIDLAKETGDWLAAPLPDILTQIDALQAAVDTFVDSAIEETGSDSDGGSGSDSGSGSEVGAENPVYPENGKYYMSFEVFKDGSNSASMMNDYVVNKALVEVNGSTKKVSFTVQQSAEITGLKLNGSSGSVSNRDKSSNTRVVTFTLTDLSGKIPGWVKVYWDLGSFVYDHEYDVQFKFDEGSATYAGTNPSVPGGNGNVGFDDDDYEELFGDEEDQSDSEDVEGDGEEVVEGDDSETETGQEEQSQQNNAPQFKDTHQHWAKSNIEKAVSLGIVNGYSDGNFRPDGTVTRGEFAVMISRALKLDEETSDLGFSDSDSIPNWAESHIRRVISAGLLSGYTDHTFRADGQLSRAQLAVIIARAAGLQLDETAEITFNDETEIPAWAQKEVSAAVKAGLIQGKGDGTFAPNETATRAEALTMIIRLLEYLNTLESENE